MALGATLKGDQELAELVTNELTEEDFYSDSHRRLFKAIKDLADEGLSVNPVSVMERSRIALDEVNDIADRAKGVTPSQLRTFTADIRRVAGLRKVYYACGNATNLITKEAKLEEVLDKLESGLYRLDGVGSHEAKDGADVLRSVKEDFIRRSKEGGGPVVSTGLKALDRAIISLKPGQNIVVAARPGMGKTALANTIRRAVNKQGLGVIQFSLEMSAEELAELELAYQADVNLRKILSAKDVTDDERGRVDAGAGSAVPGIWYVDDSTYNIAGIRRRARILAGKMARADIKLGLVVLDYIQLAGDNGDGREQSVAAISRGCKLMAKELQCTVLALSQLNRACEGRDDKRPLMADLRESGAIEQDADKVIFVYRDAAYDSSADPSEAELIIRKQRNGPTGTVKVKFIPKNASFADRDVVGESGESGTQGNGLA